MLKDADQSFLDHLTGLLPEGTVFAPEDRYRQEPRGQYHGRAAAVLKPRTTSEVSGILAAAQAARVGVIPFGGGTGLVGGQVCVSGPVPVVVSLERMNTCRAAHAAENILIAEAGMTVAAIKAKADQMDLLFPMALASEGSAQLGGVLATNAGGLNVLRYGNARDLVFGVEAVMADGTVYQDLKRLRKDNTGYDLRHLLIGSEGTLGIITAASLRLFAKPAEFGTALLAVTSIDAALHLLDRLHHQCPNMIDSFELIHRQGFEFLKETGLTNALPLGTDPEWSILVELGFPTGIGPPGDHLERLFAHGLDQGLCQDGIIAKNETERQRLWAMRENIPIANRRIGALASHDISLPQGEIASFVDHTTVLLQRLGAFRVNCFGHLGDGNLHFNVFPSAGRAKSDYPPAVKRQIMEIVHGEVFRREGSISAEHGLGRLKTGDLQRYGRPGKLQIMTRLKSALDPFGILNPGAIFDRDPAESDNRSPE